MKYSRVLLKLSGEALMGNQSYGFDPDRIATYAEEVSQAVKAGVQLAVVIGGGNIFRGLKGSKLGIDRVNGDQMGMLATVINALAIQAALENTGLVTKVLAGMQINPVCDLFSARKAKECLDKGKVVIIAGGTGNPFFTTDTAAVLRALEIDAQIVLKGTRVDGVYDDNPEKNPDAKMYETLTFRETLQQQLEVMDMTAFTLCSENDMPIVVFNMNTPGNLLKVLRGEKVGTLVKT